MGMLDDDLARLQGAHVGRGDGGYESVTVAALGGTPSVSVLGMVDGPRSDRGLDDGEMRTERVSVSGMRREVVVAGLGREVRTGDRVTVSVDGVEEEFSVISVEQDAGGVDVQAERVVRVSREVRQS